MSAVAGWIAVLLIPLAGLLGWILRRRSKGRYILRMRPHFLAGYGALAVALLHLATSTGAMAGTNATGIQLATLALFGLGLQAFVGASLQSPGGYRVLLRRWHVVLFVLTFALVAGHIALNASFVPQMGAPLLGIKAF